MRYLTPTGPILTVVQSSLSHPAHPENFLPQAAVTCAHEFGGTFDRLHFRHHQTIVFPCTIRSPPELHFLSLSPITRLEHLEGYLFHHRKPVWAIVMSCSSVATRPPFQPKIVYCSRACTLTFHTNDADFSIAYRYDTYAGP